ncbi:putative NOC2 family protein [Golovinomyces cichoracearum]|uniref:Putative NOC2 family protein n=1 Tax=Golovinomyces cichoracearum TaxID=62708 RepID=A0A420IPG2_9PEZI|nr:putative NOC2 family protein [Golovinomyces cichoracearum]
MAKNSKKSTRKFEKNQLKDVIERRKAGAKIKQRQQVKAKRRLRNAESSTDDTSERPNVSLPKNQDFFENMNVDDFFQGGFDIPKKSEKPTGIKVNGKSSTKRKRLGSDSEDNNSDELSSVETILSSNNSEDESEAEDDFGMSKQVMDGLSEKDPEFYKFLKENDPEALDYDENANFSEIEEVSASDEEQSKKKRKKSTNSKDEEDPNEETDSSVINTAIVKKWTKAMTEKFSLRAMRQVVLAFRTAAYVNEDDGNKHKYSILSSEVYHELVVTALNNIPLVLQHHLPIKESSSGKVRISTDSKKFKTLTPLLKSHSTSINHLLVTLSDPATVKMTLSSITQLIPYVIPFKKILKSIVQTVVDIWSDISYTEATRITAFLALRRLVVIGDPGIREVVLKTIYQGLVKSSRSTTIHTIQGINLMKNSAAELWGIDASVGYTTGFTFIRQLAIHLRNSITNNQKESYKTVYNWQYIHSLDFWSCVLSEHSCPLKEAETGKESELRPLIYPTVQITLGALRLIPLATYFPLRFHLIRSLLRISRATGIYIPLASPLLEVLNSSAMKKAPKSSTLKPFDFAFNYRAQKTYLHTRVYQDNVGEQIVELLSEFFVLWSTSIAFPELALPVVIMLKRWVKDVSKKNNGNKNPKVVNLIMLLVQKLDANAKWIEMKRAQVDFAPNKREGVDEFLKGFDWEKSALGAFVAGQRKQREENSRLLEEGRRQEEVKEKTENLQKKGNDAEWSDEYSN